MGFGIKKEAGSNTTPSDIVNFDKLTPTTAGVVFDPNTPATEDILYVSSVDASTWIWNGTAYITYSPPATATTEWYLNGTSIDAGSNKTAAISRNNSIYVNFNDSFFNSVRIGRGRNNIATNTVVGSGAGNTISTGSGNSFLGANSGRVNSIGNFNTFFGTYAGYSNTFGNSNTFIGNSAGYNCTIGEGNVSIGYLAGKFYGNLELPLTTGSNSVYIGNQATALVNGSSNEIVIGSQAMGKGANTVNIGNTSIANTYLNGAVTFNNAFTFPTTDGTATQSLVTNGAGVVSWVDGGSAIPQANTIYVDSVNGVNATTGRGDINKPYLTPEYALGNITNTGTVTATTTSTSATLTAVSDTTNIKVGQYITGTGIPYASQVVSKTSNTIVLSKACTASATITATWWTAYEVMLIGNFVATSNFHKTGFNINAKTYNASITFGNLVLFTLTVSAIIPVNISLGNTYCNHISGGLLQGGCIGVELDYGNYYSIGTGFQIGSPVGSSTFSCTNFIAIGIMFDCRFGAATFINATTFQWYGECYGLTGGIRVGSTKSEVNGIITCPTSVSAILVGGESNIYGSVTGNVTLTAGTYVPINVYANINGTTTTLGSGNIENITIHGNITGNISNLSPLRILGVVNGNITNNGGSVGETVCIGKITGTVTCTTGTFLYLAQQTGTHSSNSMSGVIIGNGNFVNSGGINLNTITYTGIGTFTNNGKINCFVAANNAPSYTLSSGGTFINNGTIESTSDCAAIFDKSASSTFVNNGVMINPLGMYIRYLTNSSPSRDLIIGNSICNGNLYAKPSAGCGTVNTFSVILANTNTSVDIFDGTSTVTISVVGAGKSLDVICAEIVTLIKASILKFQGVKTLGANRVIFVPLTGVTPTFTNLVNVNSVGTFNGGGGFTANVLASGTELASSFYSNF